MENGNRKAKKEWLLAGVAALLCRPPDLFDL
jgi:hypothetical protein